MLILRCNFAKFSRGLSHGPRLPLKLIVTKLPPPLGNFLRTALVQQ